MSERFLLILNLRKPLFPPTIIILRYSIYNPKDKLFIDCRVSLLSKCTFESNNNKQTYKIIYIFDI